ncbi:MAG: pyridoxamine 5'-phosphate oxidase family protein [Phycisphaerales bacterium]
MALIDYERIAEETWTRLALACDDPTRPMRTVVLASVNVRHAPDARLMILRGVDRQRSRLWFYTDIRSAKLEQLRAQPAVTVVAWDPADCIQLRFNGTATIQTNGEHIDDHWRQASMGLQVLLASPDDPGRPLTRPDPRLVGMKHSLDAGEEKAARARFAVIEIALSSAEWLQISGDEQRRAIMHGANGWAVQPLAP